jgi:hypothetical protein
MKLNALSLKTEFGFLVILERLFVFSKNEVHEFPLKLEGDSSLSLGMTVFCGK